MPPYPPLCDVGVPAGEAAAGGAGILGSPPPTVTCHDPRARERLTSPGGWEQLATKEDLKALEKSIGVEMREGFAAVHVVLAGVVEKSGKASERRAGVFYANFLTLLVLVVLIVSVVVSLD